MEAAGPCYRGGLGGWEGIGHLRQLPRIAFLGVIARFEGSNPVCRRNVLPSSQPFVVS
jgi:hypothetical protein